MSDQHTYDTPRGLRAVGRYTALVVVAVIVLFPIYTTLVAALAESGDGIAPRWLV